MSVQIMTPLSILGQQKVGLKFLHREKSFKIWKTIQPKKLKLLCRSKLAQNMIPWRSDATKRDVYLGIEKYFNIGIEINTKTKKGLVVYHKKYG